MTNPFATLAAQYFTPQQNGWGRLFELGEYLKNGKQPPKELTDWFCASVSRAQKTSSQNRRLLEMGLISDGRKPRGSERIRESQLTENQKIWGLTFNILKHTRNARNQTLSTKEAYDLCIDWFNEACQTAYQKAYPGKKLAQKDLPMPPGKTTVRDWAKARELADIAALQARQEQSPVIKAALERAFAGLPRELENNSPPSDTDNWPPIELPPE